MLSFYTIFLFIVLFASYTPLKAQIYAGGEGDGYAQATLVLTPRMDTQVGIQSFQPQKAIAISQLQLQHLQLPCKNVSEENINADCHWEIYDMNGKKISNWFPNQNSLVAMVEGYYFAFQPTTNDCLGIWITR